MPSFGKNSYAHFYLILKAHKLKPGQTVDHLKSRPIISCPGSLLYGLGVWVDRKLQEVAQETASYFKNTLELKKQLLELHLPPNAHLSTTDAMSIYTNIPTHMALNLISKYLTQCQRKLNRNYPHDAVFTFGDLTFKQLNGTAMARHPHHHMPPSIMESMKKNSSHITPNTSFTTKDLSTTSLVSGVPAKTQSSTHSNGTHSRTQ